MEKKTVIIEVQTESGVKQLDRLSAKFDEVYGDVLPLTASIGELEDQLYQMALEGQKGTKEFNLLAAEAGRLKKTLQQVDLEVDGLSMTTANKLGGALGGVTAGFELAQGAMGAMGVESEKVQEALLKVQSAMAIAQGVQGLKESIPVFKAIGAAGKAAFTGIKGAIMATGIGALIVGVGLLISNWEKVTEVTKKAADAGKQMVGDFASKYPKTFKAVRTYLEWAFMPITLAYKGAMMLYDALSGTTEASRKAGALAEQNHKNHIKQLDEEQKARDENLKGLDRKIALLEAEGKSTIKLREEKIKLQKQEAEANLAFAEYMKGRMKGNEIFEQSFADMVSAAKDSLNGIEVEEKKLSKEKSDINKQNSDNYKANLQAQKDALAEKNAADLEAYKEKQDAERQMLLDEEAWKLEQETIIKENKTKQAEQEQQLQWEKEAADALALSNRIKAEEDAEAQILANKRRAQVESIQIAEQYANSVNNLTEGIFAISNAFGKQDEKSKDERARRQFKVQKALNLSLAIIDGVKAVQASLAQSPIAIGPIPNPAGIASLAFAVATSVGNIAKIASTQYSGGGGGGGGAGSIGGGGTPNLPASQPAQFNVVGNSGTNQLANVEGNTPVKAYVVSGDVTSAQSLERNKIVTATL